MHAVAEVGRRGATKASLTSEEGELTFLAERAYADPERSLRVGSKTLADLTEDDLQATAYIAYRRYNVLTGITHYLNGAANARFSVSPIFE